MTTRPIRAAVLGAGFFGGTLADAAHAHPAFDVEVVSDVDSDAAAALAQRVGARARDLSEIASAEVDLVFVATPNHTHAATTIDLLDAGRHVFVEKPLTITGDDALAVVRAAEVSRGQLIVGHIERCLPGIKRIHDLVTSGALGALTEGYAARTRLVHLPNDTKGWWKLDTARSGGELLHEIHELDLLVWLFGEPVEVRSTAGASQRVADHDVPSVHSSTLQFESGAVGHHLLSTSAHRAEWVLRVSGDTAAVEVDLRTATATMYVDGAATLNWGVFDVEAANDSLRESASRKQAYNAPGAAGPLWMREAVRCELDEVAAAVHGEGSVLLAEPAGAVLVAVAAGADAAREVVPNVRPGVDGTAPSAGAHASLGTA